VALVRRLLPCDDPGRNGKSLHVHRRKPVIGVTPGMWDRLVTPTKCKGNKNHRIPPFPYVKHCRETSAQQLQSTWRESPVVSPCAAHWVEKARGVYGQPTGSHESLTLIDSAGRVSGHMLKDLVTNENIEGIVVKGQRYQVDLRVVALDDLAAVQPKGGAKRNRVRYRQRRLARMWREFGYRTLANRRQMSIHMISRYVRALAQCQCRCTERATKKREEACAAHLKGASSLCSCWPSDRANS
jgi:hypothetical protein